MKAGEQQPLSMESDLFFEENNRRMLDFFPMANIPVLINLGVYVLILIINAL